MSTFVPVHGLRGSLAVALTDSATTMSVDDASLCLLRAIVKDDNYTYLLIRAGYNYEIVKMSGFVGTALDITRAQDGTTAQAFPVGTEVDFVLSSSAIEDIISDKLLGQVNITGEGEITVTKNGPNDYTISAPKINITSDSDKILVGGEYPNFVISAPLLNCCSSESS